MGYRFRCAAALGLLAAGGLCAAPAFAQTQVPAPERYSLRGFGGWALGHTDNANQYGYIASGDAEYDNYNLALNLGARPTQELMVRAQGFLGNDMRGRRIDVDYVFAEWGKSPKLKIRAGKVLSPFGLYTETHDVGTLRPFYLLPDFYNGNWGPLPKAYLGAGLTGIFALGENWELGYDAIGGETRFEPISYPMVVGMDPTSGMPLTQTFQLQLIGREMFGGRLGVASSSHGLQVGVSALHFSLYQSVDGGARQPSVFADTATLGNAYLQYERGPFMLRSEYFRAFADTVHLDSAYVEASYKIGRHWQVAGSYDRARLDPEPGSVYALLPEQMKHHDSFGLALNFWASPEVVFKLNGYHIDGNQSARTPNAEIDAALGRLDETTNVVVFGVQFSF